MAKTTVDLILLLKALNDPNNKDMASITVWSNGSFILNDSGGNTVLDSDKIEEGYTCSDVHGLLYMTVPQITKLIDNL